MSFALSGCDKKFRRQHPIGPFFADFACADFACTEMKLILEIDGGYHDYMVADDLRRQQYLEGQGWRVLRFSNEDVIDNVEAVAISIAKEMGLAPFFKPRLKVQSGMRTPRTPTPKKAK